MTAPPITSARSAVPPRSDSDELVHSLRNILAAMTYGLDALDVVAPKASREREFINIQAALRKQIERLRDAVAEAARLLESPCPPAKPAERPDS